MDTTAETFVGTGDHDKSFLVLRVLRFRLGLFEHGIRCLAIRSRLAHGSLGFTEFGGRDDFHRLGDFLDVADGFKAAFDFSEGGIVGG